MVVSIGRFVAKPRTGFMPDGVLSFRNRVLRFVPVIVEQIVASVRIFDRTCFRFSIGGDEIAKLVCFRLMLMNIPVTASCPTAT